jgi:hypothetical protein
MNTVKLFFLKQEDILSDNKNIVVLKKISEHP